jgi:hypothetical protein
MRSLAVRTLEAYRALNEAAADAALPARARRGSDGLARAAELLEGVLEELKDAPAARQV